MDAATKLEGIPLTKTVPGKVSPRRLGASFWHQGRDGKDKGYGPTPGPAPRPAEGRKFVICCLIAVLTWTVFGQTLHHDFVNYDDQTYVYQNPRIVAGLTIPGIIAAFTQPHAQNWHPLTTLSHMLDCRLFGLNPAGHHFVNVLLHTTAALLLFLLLTRMTGALWPSAFATAIFAIHPLRVESVAWIAERKDVLSGVFFVLTLHAYVRYVRQPRLKNYALVLVAFGCALMSKPTVVMLPVLLLLLDYWPLGRFSLHPTLQRTIIEKVPLLVMSIAECAATLLAQRQTVTYGGTVPISERCINAVISYVTYLGQIIWPTRLAAFYPGAGDRASIPMVVLCVLLLVAVTALAFWVRRRAPYLLVGWCWYLVALFPAAGLVQVGLQGRADRYTYLPQIGIGMALVWGLTELWSRAALKIRWLVPCAGMAAVVMLSWQAGAQTTFWKDTESLWTHALAVTEHNDVAHTNIAGLLLKRDWVDEAIMHYELALQAGAGTERHDHLSPALIENNLGNAFAQKKDFDSAEMHYRRALQLRPDFADARSNLSAMLVRRGKLDQAIVEYQKVVTSPPEDSASHQRLAEMLLKANRLPGAVAQYRQAVGLAPDSLELNTALAWLLATAPDPSVRNGDEALSFARRAVHLTGGKDPVVLRALAASYAADGRWSDAVATADRARSLVQTNASLIQSLDEELHRYRMGALESGGLGRPDHPRD